MEEIPALIIECKSLTQLFFWTRKLFSKKDELLIDLTHREGHFYAEVHGLSSIIKHPVILKILIHSYHPCYREYWTERKWASEKLEKVKSRLQKLGYNITEG